jgi:hypothetical protein
MLFAVGVNAAAELGRLVGVAGLAIDRRNLVGMRIALDVGVAVGALQAAVNAVAEFFAVDGDAVSGAVGHAGIAVAGQAVLRAGKRGFTATLPGLVHRQVRYGKEWNCSGRRGHTSEMRF